MSRIMSRFLIVEPMSLTELKIKNLKPKNKIYRIADSSGLCLEVSTSGSKLWRWRYYFDGKPQMHALGKYPAMSLAGARRKRDEVKIQVQAGKHPTREKKAERRRQAYINLNTFEKIAREWNGIRNKGLNEKYSKDLFARLEREVFPKIGYLPITDITIPDIVQIIQDIGNRGTVETAKRVKQNISQVFRYAAAKGLCSTNPASDIKEVLPKQDKKHYACIHPDELPALLSKIETIEESIGKTALKFLMLTFVRTNELIGARWDEINWNKKEWHIPKERMKMRRPHIVPLSEQAIEMLKKVKTQTGTKPFIFYSHTSKSKHISNTNILMSLRRIGYYKKMTGHGFRALASTILNEKRYNPDAIERQLAHEDEDEVRSAYNRAEYLPERKKMMQDYADIIEQMRFSKDLKRNNRRHSQYDKRLIAE